MKAKQKMEKELNRMLTEVIHKYGFEHRNTIYFAEVVGHTNKIISGLRNLYSNV